MRSALFAFVFGLAISAGAYTDTATIDTRHTDQPFTFTIDEGTSPAWRWTIEENGTAYSIPAGTRAQWWFFEDWQSTAGPMVTGTVGSGYVDFSLTPTQTGTNFAPVSQILLLTSNGVPWKAWRGAGEIRESPGTAADVAALTTPLVISAYAWSGVFDEGQIPATWLTNVTAGSGITQSAADARYVARQGDYTGTVAGVSASIVATAATGALARVAAVESAGYLTAALAGTTYEPTGAVARATAAAGVLFQPTGTVSEADTLAAVLGRGNDGNTHSITGITGVALSNGGSLSNNVGYLVLSAGTAADDLDAGNVYLGTRSSNGGVFISPGAAATNLTGTAPLVVVYDASLAAAGILTAGGWWDWSGRRHTNLVLDAGALTGTIPTARLPPSLLYSNSVAQTLSATAAPVSGAAVDYALTSGTKVAYFDGGLRVGGDGDTNGIVLFEGSEMREGDSGGGNTMLELKGATSANTNRVHAVGLLTAGVAVDAPLIRSNGTNIFDLISAGSGDIGGVTAGAYLSGGGTSGTVSLGVTGLVNRVAVNSVTSGVDATGLVDLGIIAAGGLTDVSAGGSLTATTNGSAVALSFVGPDTNAVAQSRLPSASVLSVPVTARTNFTGGTQYQMCSIAPGAVGKWAVTAGQRYDGVNAVGERFEGRIYVNNAATGVGPGYIDDRRISGNSAGRDYVIIGPWVVSLTNATDNVQYKVTITGDNDTDAAEGYMHTWFLGL